MHSRVAGLRGLIFAGAVAGLSIISAAVVRADVRTGVEAYKRGDYEVALREFLTLAEQGEPRAQYNLSVMYLKGQGVEKNRDEAVKWQRRAAEGGLSAAQHGLGVMYYRGEGVERDFVEAAKWFRRAAHQGYPTSQLNLGVMYFTGLGVEKDNAEVVKWVSLAAAKGLPEALFRLGQMYERGAIFARRTEDALYWYNKAAERGHDEARRRLAALAAGAESPADTAPPLAAPEDAPAGLAQPDQDTASDGEDTAPATPVDQPAGEVAAAPEANRPGDGSANGPAGWRVQLASFRTAREAELAWGKLRDAYSEMLAGLDSDIRRVDLGPERGIYHRLRAGPLSSREAAFALCNRLKAKARGQGCIPLPPGR